MKTEKGIIKSEAYKSSSNGRKYVFTMGSSEVETSNSAVASSSSSSSSSSAAVSSSAAAAGEATIDSTNNLGVIDDNDLICLLLSQTSDGSDILNLDTNGQSSSSAIARTYSIKNSSSQLSRELSDSSAYYHLGDKKTLLREFEPLQNKEWAEMIERDRLSNKSNNIAR